MTEQSNTDRELRVELWRLFESTPDKKDGQGTVNHFFDVLIPHLTANYISRKEVEEAIGITDDILRRPTFEQAKTEIAIRDAFRDELRAKLLAPTRGGNDEKRP